MHAQHNRHCICHCICPPLSAHVLCVASRSVTSVKYTFQITNDNSRYELFVRKDMAKVLPRRGQMESGDVFLVDEHGMRWKVHDRRVKTQRHLKQGWKEFAEGHNLGTGDCLGSWGRRGIMRLE